MAENKSIIQKLKELNYRRDFLTGALIGAGGTALVLQGIPADRNGVIALVLISMTLGIAYAEKQSRENQS